jgi:hypothetical protein
MRITLMDATADADFGTTENVQHSNSFYEAKERQRNVVYCNTRLYITEEFELSKAIPEKRNVIKQPEFPGRPANG